MASIADLPGPISASPIATAINVKLYSYPFAVDHKPFSACTFIIAISIVPATIIAATGVKNPAPSNIPPISSANPAKSTLVTLGFMPINSNQPPVPFNPYPQNQSNSFCAPCPINKIPITNLMMNKPKSIINPSVIILNSR